MIENKKILLGVCGGIAAYKTLELASALKKRKACVKVIATEAALKFVHPLSWKAITHDTVVSDMFDPEHEMTHINLADWADLFIIAPATANTIGKLAAGIADNLLTTTILAYTKKVLLVPAMNVHMYNNKIMQANMAKLRQDRFHVIEPEVGILACGYSGKGRYPQTKEILYFAESLLFYKCDLTGKKVMITAGSTKQKIDPMRYLTNHASGKMGIELARAATIRGAQVTLIAASVQESIPSYLHAIIQVETADEMYEACIANAKAQNIIIKAAAVSDYTPEKTYPQKLKKNTNLCLNLVRTTDILFELGSMKKADQILVGFAAETENIIENAKQKLVRKKCDFIVANNLEVVGKDRTEVTILSKRTEKKAIGSKFDVANLILDSILNEK